MRSDTGLIAGKLLFKWFCKLVGAAGAFEAAAYAAEARNYFFGRHTVTQGWNSFKVAVAAAAEWDVRDDAAFVDIKCYTSGTRSVEIAGFFHVLHSLIFDVIIITLIGEFLKDFCESFTKKFFAPCSQNVYKGILNFFVW